MKSKLVLANGTEIEIENGSSMSDIRVICADRESLDAILSELTEENLKEVTILDANDKITGAYENLKYVSETSMPDEGGTISCSIRLRRKTETELRLDALEETQADQDAAIEDLGALTSDLAGEKG